MFHLMTHAFFKALLFLAAGIVIHALAGEQDMRKMGGLRAADCRGRTARSSSARSRSSAIPPFSGFFSKDSILAARARPRARTATSSGSPGIVGAFLTGLYTFRLLFLVFGGEPSPFAREHLPHAERGEGPARR